MAAAAVAMNPVLALLIARLQRVMVTGLWEVRIAAAQVKGRLCDTVLVCLPCCQQPLGVTCQAVD
jgi:hypothetical protein